MLSSIKALIELDEYAKEFTNDDTLTGRAIAQLDKDSEVERITIRYVVRAVSCVMISTGTSTATLNDEYIIHEQAEVVFPPGGLTGKTFTLQSGEHVFDYSFTIPQTGLPASYKDSVLNNNISHFVEIIVKRPCWYKANSSAKVLFTFWPLPDPALGRSLLVSQSDPKMLELHKNRSGLFSRRKSQVTLAVQYPEVIPTDGTCDLSLEVNSIPYQDDAKQPLKITDVSVVLRSYLWANAEGATESQKDVKKVLIDQKDIKGTEGETARLECEAKLGQVTPTFSTPILQLQWFLEIVVRVSNCYRSKSQKLKHKLEVKVETGAFLPEYDTDEPLPQYSRGPKGLSNAPDERTGDEQGMK